MTDRDIEWIVEDMVEQYGDAFRRLAEYDATGVDPGAGDQS